MPLEAIEPLMLLSSVPGDIAIPVSGAAVAVFGAMGRVIVVLYNNGRKDSIDAVSALKDATHAIDKVTASNDKQAAAIERLAAIVQDDRQRRAAGG